MAKNNDYFIIPHGPQGWWGVCWTVLLSDLGVPCGRSQVSGAGMSKMAGSPILHPGGTAGILFLSMSMPLPPGGLYSRVADFSHGSLRVLKAQVWKPPGLLKTYFWTWHSITSTSLKGVTGQPRNNEYEESWVFVMQDRADSPELGGDRALHWERRGFLVERVKNNSNTCQS